MAADLSDAADVQRLARELGEVDILINNAGIALFAPTAEFEVSAFDTMFASNVRAPFFLVAAFAPGMQHGATAASSASAVWPAAWASLAAQPTARQRRRSRR